MVPLRVEIRKRFMTVLSNAFKRGKECNRTDLIACANYEYDRYLLGVKLTRGHAHKTRSWYLLGDVFKKSDDHPCHFYMGAPPPPPPPQDRNWLHNQSEPVLSGPTTTNGTIGTMTKHSCPHMGSILDL